jgi:mRNA interferase MazF
MSAQPAVRRGCIYLVDFGAEAAGRQSAAGPSRLRPALVVQNDLGNEAAATTIVVGLSSHLPSRLYPFQVALPPEVLGKAGVILCEQIRTVSLERVEKTPLAECPQPVMQEVDAALRRSLGLEGHPGTRV